MRMLIATALFLTSFYSYSQNQSEGKWKTDTLKVEGICGMCEDRIEEACNLSKGVKISDWDKDSKMLVVTYNTKKTDLNEIAGELNKVGHDNEISKSTDKQYGKIHQCCRYREMKGH